MCKDVSKELLHLYVTKLFWRYSLMHFFLLYNIYNNVYGNTNILLLQIDVKNANNLYVFLVKSFGGSRKSHTFASAFENERNLKQNEIKLCSRSKKKEFFEKIYIRQIK